MRVKAFAILLCLAIGFCKSSANPSDLSPHTFPHYAPSDAAKYFHYPKATMVWTEGPQGESTTFSTSYSQRTDNSAPPEFQQSEIMGSYSIIWRFVRMTAEGDEYHFTLRHHAPAGWEKPVEMDLVFKGTKLTVMNQPGIKVEILPEPPKKAAE